MAATPSPQYNDWVPGVEINHVNAARVHLQAMLPEASLNPSSVEMTLIEALTVVLGPVALSYQRAPAAVVEHFMALHSLYRHQGQKAVGKAKFKVSDATAEVKIPSGTPLRYMVDDYAGSLDFVTTQDITIYTSETREGEAWIEAVETGTAYNGLMVGTYLDTVNYHLQVQSVSISLATRDGEDPEDDASFEERSRALMSRQTAALAYADQFEAAVKTREEVGRAFTVDNWDAVAGASAIGHVTVAVTSISGETLPPADLPVIRDWLQGQVLASLVVHVIDPTYTTVNLAVTVEATATANHDEVKASIEAELNRRLDPLRWNWWSTITGIDIASWIDDVPGVARVITVPPPITLGGVAPLPRPGAFDIDVNPATR